VSLPVLGFAGMTHLGINSAAAAAAHGFPTLCYDADPSLILQLKRGRLPVVEPELPQLIRRHEERITFSAESRALQQCSVVYVACDVPTDDEGKSDLTGIRALAASVAGELAPDAVLVVLCQVPPGFTRTIEWPVQRLYYQVETLIFGHAVERALYPERFIIGCADPGHALPAAYRAFLEAFGCPMLPMRYESAELAKIAINCCLAASVTVANTLAELSEHIDADWHEIVPALKLDRRIGQHAYLSPGLGLAGGNLERDLATVLRLAGATGSEAGLIGALFANSRHRKDWVLRALHREVFSRTPNATIAVLGLAYKENTHSTRNSAALALIRHLALWPVRVHDPVVPAEAVRQLNVTGCDSALEAARHADVLVIMTPWPAFRELKALDLAHAMKGRIVIDPYCVLDGGALATVGFDYLALGAPPSRNSGSETDA
jgi:UDPglucose 6-dehydrogenase